MTLHNHALYQIATKSLLYNDGRILVLFTPDDYLDFPGGRVDESERNLQWTEALKREVAEKLDEHYSYLSANTIRLSKRITLRQYFLNISLLAVTLNFQMSMAIMNGLRLKR